MSGGAAGRGAAGGAEELDEVAVLDWRDDEPLVEVLAIMGMVSKRRPPLAPLPVAPGDDSSCLGRRQRQQHTATTDPTTMKATNTEPTIRNGT